LSNEYKAKQAYLKIFDANDPVERNNLLTYILKDEQYSLLFIINCNPNKQELELALNVVLKDFKKTYILLKEQNEKNILNKEQRMKAIVVLNDHTDLIYYLASICNFSIPEKQYIYNSNKNKFLYEMTLENYWNMWTIFGDVFTEDDLDTLTELIYNYEYLEKNGFKDYYIKYMIEQLMYHGRLNKEQCNRLNSKLIILRLTE
jgi:hypothetical protein